MAADVKNLTKALKGYDSALFVAPDENGRLAVYRERLLRPEAPELVVHLTENWKDDTPNREWGALRIIEKLQSIRKSPQEALDECLQHNERVRASEERHRKSETEAFLKEIRRQFAKAFDDINTSTIRKTDRRREMEKKYGYR